MLVARDGTEIPIDDSGAPMRDTAGTIGALCWSSGYHRTAAGRATDRLASIVESSEDIISKDLGMITSWNKGAERSLGMLGGGDWYSITHH
jgi:hypothetical protein